MRLADQIRIWRGLGICTLLCCSTVGISLAQTETAAPANKPQHASAVAAKKTPASGHATGKRTSSSATAHASSRTPARTSSRTSAQKSKSSHSKKGSRQVAKKRGQQAIDSDRAREIQTVLIRERYMQGEPSGTWDSATQAAMQRYQADQGWQSKTTPDSRALIKLGLGPSHDHLLNPESAMTSAPTTAVPTTTAPTTANSKGGPNQTPAEDNSPKN